MKLNKKQKAWIVENKGIAADATDEVFSKAWIEAITDGSMDNTKQLELLKDESAPAMGQQILSAIEGLKQTPATTTDQDSADAIAAEAEVQRKAAEVAKAAAGSPTPSSGPSGAAITAVASHPDTVKVTEMYTGTKSQATYGAKAWQGDIPVTHGGRGVMHASDFDKAVCSAYFKHALYRGGGHRYVEEIPKSLLMTDHDRELLRYAVDNLPWTGIANGGICELDKGCWAIDNRKLHVNEKIGLLDDAATGGIEVVPIVFDDAIILTPVLHSEFFNKVNVIPIARGRRIEGATMNNPTLQWGGSEGTAIAEFDATSFVGEFNTSIFELTGSMRLGMDFESDSPVAIGQAITSQYGQVFMAELDRVVALGNGTSEPEGVLNKAGVTSIAQAGAVADVDLYESLLFGIAKQFRPPQDRARVVYGGTETSYQRARAIPVSVTDQRRIFGLTHEDYMLLGHPYAINESFSNAEIVFANLAHYRMYRRLGMTVRVETGGLELALANQRVIIIRARYGGQMELSGYASLTTTAEA